ncbi:hypothetical protein [uncultured Helicobacter sp.]
MPNSNNVRDSASLLRHFATQKSHTINSVCGVPDALTLRDSINLLEKQ